MTAPWRRSGAFCTSKAPWLTPACPHHPAAQRRHFDIVHIDSLQALQQLELHAFDLILADYRLPGFTALDVWAHVASQPGHPPCVLLSGAIG